MYGSEMFGKLKDAPYLSIGLKSGHIVEGKLHERIDVDPLGCCFLIVDPSNGEEHLVVCESIATITIKKEIPTEPAYAPAHEVAEYLPMGTQPVGPYADAITRAKAQQRPTDYSIKDPREEPPRGKYRPRIEE